MSGQIACKECRQQKVRCSGRTVNNEACERCARRHLVCVIDNSYKRTVKRKAIESLEAEIAALRGQLDEEKRMWSPSKRTSLENLSPARFAVPATPGKPRSPVHIETWFCPPKSTQAPAIEPITLESSTIEVLFREYVSKYHEVLPVVEVQKGPEHVYNASAALFWTVMSIAARRRVADLPQGLTFDRLCAAQKHHISEIAVSPVLGQGKSSEFNLSSVYAVQAFLLSTLWPPPTSSINADMSWNTSGIALFTAIRAGLHCPGHSKDFERIFKSNKLHQSNVKEQYITWLATNALNQAISNMFGYPSSAHFRALSSESIKNMDLPPRVQQMYEIQRVAHEIEISLGQLDTSSALDKSMTTSLIRIHASRYDRIELEHGARMDPWTWFTLHAGRAQLFSYYLFEDNISEEGVLALYNSCLALLNHVMAQSDEFMKYLPVVSIMILWQTSSIVARLWHSRWSANLDKPTGEKLYRRAVRKLVLSSIFEHDLPFRASEIMAQMWAAFSAMHRSNHHKAVSAKLTLRSRMSASAFFDCLWMMKEESEIRSQAPTTLTRPSSQVLQVSGSYHPTSAVAQQAYSARQVQQSQSTQPAEPQSQPSSHAASPQPQLPHQLPDGHPGGTPSIVTPQTQSLEPKREIAAAVQPYTPTAHPIPSPSQPTQTPAPRITSAPRPVAPAIDALLSPDPNGGQIQHLPPSLQSTRSPVSPVSPLIDPSWTMDADAATAIWKDVNAVMEDFGFGLGELPYVSP